MVLLVRTSFFMLLRLFRLALALAALGLLLPLLGSTISRLAEAENSSGQEVPVQPAVQNYASASGPAQNYALQQAPPLPPTIPINYLIQQQQAKPLTQSQQTPSPPSSEYWGLGSSQANSAPANQRNAPAFDCSGKEDGVYLKDAKTCTDTFYKCANAYGYKYSCPFNLFYNVDNNQCDHKQNVVACGGQAPATTAAPDLITATRKAVVFDCSGKTDGYYQPQLCSPVFFSCIGGMDSQINCPAGTVFDITVLKCDYPSECGQPRTTAVPQVQQSQAISHGNTDYYLNPEVQQPQYQAPEPTQVLMPVNQAPQKVVAHQPAQQYLVPKPAYQAPQQATPSPQLDYNALAAVAQSYGFSCDGKKDGYYYKKPCTASFLICSAGHVTTETCPGNLVFDPTVAHCQYPDVCGKPIATTTAASLQYPTMVYPQAILTATAKPAVNFDCSGLPDGYTYKTACTNTFYTCASGHTIELNCPASLVFDPASASCLYPAECGKPKPQQPVAQTPALQSYYTVPPSVYATPTPATAPAPVVSVRATVQQQQAQDSGLNCAGRSDGYYWKQKCTEFYYSCNQGYTVALSCPNGLVFDPLTMMCDYRSECGKPVTTTPVSAATSVAATVAPRQRNPGYQRQQNYQQPQAVQQQPQAYASAPVQQQKPSVSGLNCAGRSDGYYWKQKCTESYYSCNGENTIALSCPSGLVFDPLIMQCDYPSECGKPMATTAAPPQQSPVTYEQPQPSQQQPSYQGYQQQVDKKPKNFSCSGRIDGYYIKKSCTTPYFSCVGGISSQLSCPAGLVFDVKTASCEYPDQCGKATTTTVPALDINTPATPARVNYKCSGKPDGYYSFVQESCQNQYVACINGQAYLHSCQSQLVFNELTGNCDYNCEAHTTQASAPAAPQQQPYQAGIINQPSAYSNNQVSNTQQHQSFFNNYNSNTYAANQQAATQATTTTTEPPVPASEFDCSKQETGYYSKGCSGRYYSCHSGSTYAFQCASDLKYSQTISACDYPANVPECGGKPPVAPQNQPVQQSSSSYGQQTAQKSSIAQSSNSVVLQQEYVKQGTARSPLTTANCGSLTTGTHELALCSASYLTCWNGHQGQGTCFNDMVYNPLNGQCDHPINVKGCAQFSVPGPVSNRVPYGTKSNTTSQVPVSSYNAQPQQQKQGQMEPKAIPPNVCQQNQQTDGYIAIGCSSLFFHCSGGVTNQLTCASGLFYDTTTGNCDYKNSVPACGGKRTETPAK